VVLPDTAEVEAERERRRHFDEEWNAIGDVLASVALEPMMINVSTKLDEEAEPAGPSMPRTTREMAEEILDTLNSRFNLRLTVFTVPSML